MTVDGVFFRLAGDSVRPRRYSGREQPQARSRLRLWLGRGGQTTRVEVWVNF